MEPAPLGWLIDRLEESGWVRRAPSAADRRANLVHLTDKLLPLIEDLRAAADNLYKDAFKGMSNKNVEDFVEALTIAKSNLNDLSAEPVGYASDSVDELNRVQRKASKNKSQS